MTPIGVKPGDVRPRQAKARASYRGHLPPHSLSKTLSVMNRWVNGLEKTARITNG